MEIHQMARSDRGIPLYWGIVFLSICSLWLILMLSNRSVVLPLFFLGSQPLTLPVSFWLFGAFVLGNGVSLGILGFLQFTIVRLAQDQGRSGFRVEGIPPRDGLPRTAPTNPSVESEWEEDEFDWEEEPPRQETAQSPASKGLEEGQTENGDQRPEPPAQAPRGPQGTSSETRSPRPAPRPQEPSPPKRNPQVGFPQRVVDVNYRVINPGSKPDTSPAPSPQKGRKPGWDDESIGENW